MNWSEEQVLALSPDVSSTKSGKDLARPEKWQVMALEERALWGEIKGSGSTPYRTQIDLQNIAFKCSCPSRKFPCKHGLGLFLIYARKPDVFTPSPPPDWVTEWLEKRGAKSEKKEEAITKTPDPNSQAKRAEAREAKIRAGLQEISLWVKDLIRNGLLAVPEKSRTFWQNPVARMVDAQAPGLAGLIRSLGNIGYFAEGWQGPLLEKLTQIYLITQAYPELANLPEDLQTDLKTLVGWPQNQEELKSQAGIRDSWLILGKQVTEEANIITQTYWLYGQTSKKWAMVLNFYHSSKPTDLGLVPGTAMEGEVVYFPGSYPLRGLIKESGQTLPLPQPEHFCSLSEMHIQLAEAISVYPWLGPMPVLANSFTPLFWQDQWYLVDTDKKYILINPAFTQSWQLMALSGGHPLHIFGLYGRDNFLPLGIWRPNNYLTF